MAKKIHTYGRKALSLLLTLVMLTSMLQLTAFAADSDPEDQAFIYVEKVFQGIADENLIPENYTIQVGDAMQSMADAEDVTVGTDSVTVTWKFDLPFGKYEVIESNYEIADYDVEPAPENGSHSLGEVETKDAEMVFDATAVDIEESCNKEDWEVGKVDMIVASLTKNSGCFVWTRQTLSANERKAMVKLLADVKGPFKTEESKIKFYSGDKIEDKDGLLFRGSYIKYDGESILHFSDPSQWRQFFTGAYDFHEAVRVAEISVENTYTPHTGSLTITKSTTGATTPADAKFSVMDSNDEEVASITYADFTEGSYTFDLPVGEYTVVESNADIEDYTLTVTGNENAVAVTKGGNAEMTITNAYKAEEIPDNPPPPINERTGEIEKSKTADGLDQDGYTNVTLKLPGEETTLSSDVMFVIDKSSCHEVSSDQAMALVRKLAEAQQISGANIKVGAVVFGSTARSDFAAQGYADLVDLETVVEKKLLESTAKFGNGTNMEAGLLLAQEILAKDTAVPAANKHVILVSDGLTWAFNYGKENKDLGSITYGNILSTTSWIEKRPGCEGSNYKLPYGWDWDTYWKNVQDWVAVDGDKYVQDITGYPNNKALDPNKFVTSDYDKHALCMDRALYDAWLAYEDLQGAGYNCYAVSVGTTPLGNGFMSMLNGGETLDFGDVQDQIAYTVPAGSYVRDEIGYEDNGNGEDYDFDFVDSADTLTVKVGEVVYTTAKLETPAAGATSSYTFTAPGATEATFQVDYYTEVGREKSEYFIWTLGENLSNFAPASLTYKLYLDEAPANPGDYDLPTNEVATVYPEGGKPEDFPKPDVPYSKEPTVLKIVKTVEGLLGEDEMPSATEFTITGPDGFTPATVTYDDFTVDQASGEVYYELELDAAGEYTVTENEESAQVANYALTVTGSGEATAVAANRTTEVEITNTYAADEGTLIINKTVTGLADGDEMPDATFTVTGPYDYSETFTYADFTGGVLTIEGLPVGTYTVVESGAEIADRYELTVTYNNDAALTAGSASVVKNGEAQIAITNAYDPHLGSLTIKKSFVGENLMPQGAKFVLKSGTEEIASVAWTAFEKEVVDGQETGAYVATINNIPVGAYTLEEVGAENKTHILTVTGDKNVTIVKNDTATAALTNKYEEKTAGQLTITKEFVGIEGLDPALFAGITFTVTGPNGYSKTLTYGEDFNQGTYTLNGLAAGTYTVTENRTSAEISEKVEGDGYELTITVESTDASAITGNQISVAMGPIDEKEVTFTNCYVEEIGTLTITKQVIGLDAEAAAKMNATFQLKDAEGNNYGDAFTWADMTNEVVDASGNIIRQMVIRNVPIGMYSIVETGATVENYGEPAVAILYNGTAGTGVEVTPAGNSSMTVQNSYSKLIYYVVHEYYVIEDGKAPAYEETGEPIECGIAAPPAPQNATVFKAQAPSEQYQLKSGETYTYERKADSEYETEITRNAATLESGKLTYTVKYYRNNWTVGALEITKTIKGLDSKSEKKLAENLTFTVTGPDDYSETFTYGEDFEDGKLVLKNLVPGTYTVTEDTASATVANYDLTVSVGGSKGSSTEVEVKAQMNPAKVSIVNQYVGRIYTIWFDGGEHGSVKNVNGLTFDGVYRSMWWEYKPVAKVTQEGSYDWANLNLSAGQHAYYSANGDIYPNLVEYPMVTEGTQLAMFTFTGADWAEHSKDMYIGNPGLEVDEGYTSDGKFYIPGTEIAFTTIADAVVYMDENVEPDANGIYNVTYRAVYDENSDGGDKTPDGGDKEPEDDDKTPGGGGGNGGGGSPLPPVIIPDVDTPKTDLPDLPDEEVPLADLPEEEVPLVDLPEEDVPLTGDASGLYVAMAAISGMGLIYLAATGKKREEEEAAE